MTTGANSDSLKRKPSDENAVSIPVPVPGLIPSSIPGLIPSPIPGLIPAPIQGSITAPVPAKKIKVDVIEDIPGRPYSKNYILPFLICEGRVFKRKEKEFKRYL